MHIHVCHTLLCEDTYDDSYIHLSAGIMFHLMPLGIAARGIARGHPIHCVIPS